MYHFLNEIIHDIINMHNHNDNMNGYLLNIIFYYHKIIILNNINDCLERYKEYGSY